jgi:Zn-finger nucleic acid-binding protein
MDKIEDLDQPHIWIENCAVCGGIFFDAGELTDLKEKTLSDWFKRFTKGSRT